MITKLLYALVALLALLMVLPAAAQTPEEPTVQGNPANVGLYRFELFMSPADYTANNIAAVADIPVEWVTCNLAPSLTPPGPFFEVLPGGTATIEWNDTLRVGRVCKTQNVMPLLVQTLAKFRNQEFPWRVRAIGKITEPVPQPLTTLKKPGATACVPPTGRAAMIAVTVNSVFPTNATAKSQVRVEWRLSNVNPVVYVQVLLNNIEVAAMTGDDLARLSGMYYTAPAVPGTYNLTVYARDLAGCDYRSGLVRQVTVK